MDLDFIELRSIRYPNVMIRYCDTAGSGQSTMQLMSANAVRLLCEAEDRYALYISGNIPDAQSEHAVSKQGAKKVYNSTEEK